MIQHIKKIVKENIKRSLLNGTVGKIQEQIADRNLKKYVKDKKVFFTITSLDNLSPFYIIFRGIAYPRKEIKYIECFIDGKLIGVTENNINIFDIWKKNKTRFPIKGGWQLFANLNDYVSEENDIVFKLYDFENNVIDEFIVDISSNTTNGAPLAKNAIAYRATNNIKDSLYEASTISKNKPIILFADLHLKLNTINDFATVFSEYTIVSLLEGLPKNKSYIKNYFVKEFQTSETNFYSINPLLVPDMFIRNFYIQRRQFAVNNELREYIYSRTYLIEVLENFLAKHNGSDISYEYLYVYYMDRYINDLLDILKPTLVILWNTFISFHKVIYNVCQQKNIKVMSYENGLLIGTYSIDFIGNMGESTPAIKWNAFKNLHVDENELNSAKQLCLDLNINRANRWAQHNVYNKNIKGVVEQKLDKSKPTILFAGHNDYESGIYPNDEHSRKYHSPIFANTYDAAKFLSGLAEKNGWNFIYKKHPMMIGRDPKNIAGNAINAHNIDIHDAIDLADVVITIVSQTSYLALIQEKPVVMLGYTQLYRKDCTYEAFSLDDIEREIKNAIEFGYTDEQKENFYKHVAQLNKYYLFNNFTQNTYTHGQSIESLKEFILNYIKEG